MASRHPSSWISQFALVLVGLFLLPTALSGAVEAIRLAMPWLATLFLIYLGFRFWLARRQ